MRNLVISAAELGKDRELKRIAHSCKFLQWLSRTIIKVMFPLNAWQKRFRYNLKRGSHRVRTPAAARAIASRVRRRIPSQRRLRTIVTTLHGVGAVGDISCLTFAAAALFGSPPLVSTQRTPSHACAEGDQPSCCLAFHDEAHVIQPADTMLRRPARVACARDSSMPQPGGGLSLRS